MEQKAIVQFTVMVTSTENASWQGIVESNGKEFEFQSELQLLRWVMEQYPSLRPDTDWNTTKNM